MAVLLLCVTKWKRTKWGAMKGAQVKRGQAWQCLLLHVDDVLQRSEIWKYYNCKAQAEVLENLIVCRPNRRYHSGFGNAAR